MKHTVWTGLALAGATALISGFSVFYNKVAVLSSIDPWVSSFVKNAAVAAIVGITLLVRRPSGTAVTVGKKDILPLAYTGIVGGGIAFLLFFTGLSTIPAIDGALIHKSQFLWVALLSPFMLGETVTGTAVVGYLIILWSNLFLGGFSPVRLTGGHALVLLSAILWSLETIAIRRSARTLNSRFIAVIRMGVGSVVIAAALTVTGKWGRVAGLTPHDMPVLAGAILLLAGYVLTWTAALSKARASAVAAVLVVATPITNILSAVFITHAMPNTAVLQAGATVLGIALVTVLSGYPLRHDASRYTRETS